MKHAVTAFVIVPVLCVCSCAPSNWNRVSGRDHTPSTYQVGASLDSAREQTLHVQKSLTSGSTALRGVSQGLTDSRTLAQRIDDKAVVLLKHWK